MAIPVDVVAISEVPLGGGNVTVIQRSVVMVVVKIAVAELFVTALALRLTPLMLLVALLALFPKINGNAAAWVAKLATNKENSILNKTGIL